MRISDQEITLFKNALSDIDPCAKLFLFGSRVFDNRKGGDIDLLILSERMNFSDKVLFLTKIFTRIEEQKIDVVLKKDNKDPFVMFIMNDAILL